MKLINQLMGVEMSFDITYQALLNNYEGCTEVVINPYG